MAFALTSLTVFTIFFAPKWFFFLVIEFFCFWGLWEYLDLAAKKDLPVSKVITLFFGLLLPFFLIAGAEVVVILAATFVLSVMNFDERIRQKSFIATAASIFGLVYVTWFFSHMIKLRGLEHGAAWVFYTVLIVKGGDAGAYFVGRKYGKTKLIPHISPNKSVEGSIGCFLTSIALSVLSKIWMPYAPFLHLLVVGALVGVLSQIGDLVESMMKREAGVKDSGQMPGLGGMLDVMDSLILTVPFVYYYLVFFMVEKT